jgi:hypothetical protein
LGHSLFEWERAAERSLRLSRERRAKPRDRVLAASYVGFVALALIALGIFLGMWFEWL